jgi:hypothetical protein
MKRGKFTEGARIYERCCEWPAGCLQMSNLAVQPVSGQFES